MDAFQFRKLTSAPLATDTIAVYEAGTALLAENLTDLAGNPLTNPFTPADAGGVDGWGFRTEISMLVDVWWAEGNIFLAASTTVSDADTAAAVQASYQPSAINPFVTQTFFLLNIADVAHEPDLNYVGFLSRTTSTLSFDNGTRAFTLTTIGSIPFFVGGTMQSTATQSVVIPNTVGLHFIYLETNNILSTSTSPWDLAGGFGPLKAPVATVYWDGTTGWIGEERHIMRNFAARAHHKWMHSTIGTRYSDGLAGTFDNTTLSIAAGACFDEDIELRTIAAKTNCRVLFRNASNQMQNIAGSTTPYYATAGVLQYDNAGTITAVPSGSYVTNWVYFTNDPDYPIYVVTSQVANVTLAGARAAVQPTIPNIATREWKLLYSVIYRNVGGTATYTESTDYRNASSLPGGVVSSLPAISVVFTPTGSIAATNVQLALEEINTEKVTAPSSVDNTVPRFDGTAGQVQTSGVAISDINEVTGAGTMVNYQANDYTVVLGDCGKTIEMGKATPSTLTIPANGTLSLPIGTIINVVQYGAGQVTIALTTDTLRSAGGLVKTRAQYSVVSLYKRATTEWVLVGDLSA